MLNLVVVGGPRQRILRSAELEAPELAEQLEQSALYGDRRLFERTLGTASGLDGSDLALRQERGAVTANLAEQHGHDVFHVGPVLGLIRHSANVTTDRLVDAGVSASVTVGPSGRDGGDRRGRGRAAGGARHRRDRRADRRVGRQMARMGLGTQRRRQALDALQSTAVARARHHHVRHRHRPTVILEL